MPHPTPQPTAGHQVERIREILMGRQMEAIEQRLERLEGNLQPMPVESPSALLDERLKDAKKEQAESLCRLRDEIDADRLRQLDETRRLAQQIQSIARSRLSAETEAIQASEQRIANWFGHWEKNLQQHLQHRENHLIQELRSELETMRGWIRRELDRKQGGQSDLIRLRGAFDQLAAATRAITESLPSGSPKP